jgi:hypothetical protein
MDYIKIFSHFYEKTITVSKRIIISEFKRNKTEKRTYNTIFNEVNSRLNNYRQEKFTNNLNDKATHAYHVFKNRYTYYQGDEKDVITLVLEREVLEAFNNSSYTSFNYFIIDLAIEQSLTEISRHFTNFYDYYELIYEYDRYEYFYLKDFEGYNYRSSSEYKVMSDEKHPDRVKQNIEINKSNFYTVQNNKNEVPDDIFSKEEWYNDRIKDFTEDERMIIISVFYESIKKNKEKGIPLTELLRLIRIVGGFVDNSVFYGEAKDNTTYSKANKGVEYYTGQSKLKKINSTIFKLDKLDLNFISEKLKSIYSKLLSE